MTINGCRCWAVESSTMQFSSAAADQTREVGLQVSVSKDSQWNCSRSRMWGYSGHKTLGFWTSLQRGKLLSLQSSASILFAIRTFRCGSKKITTPTTSSSSFEKSEGTWWSQSRKRWPTPTRRQAAWPRGTVFLSVLWKGLSRMLR